MQVLHWDYARTSSAAAFGKKVPAGAEPNRAPMFQYLML